MKLQEIHSDRTHSLSDSFSRRIDKKRNDRDKSRNLGHDLTSQFESHMPGTAGEENQTHGVYTSEDRMLGVFSPRKAADFNACSRQVIRPRGILGV